MMTFIFYAGPHRKYIQEAPRGFLADNEVHISTVFRRFCLPYTCGTLLIGQ